MLVNRFSRQTAVLGVVYFVLLVTVSWGVEIFVPADYETIQEAIEAAVDGDVVTVADGTYEGYGNRDIDPLGKAITVRSANGAANCVINCQGTAVERHLGFYIHSGEGNGTVIEGFTITGGYANVGGAFYIRSSSPVISNCIITGNAARDWGGGFHCVEGMPSITGCEISGNSAGYDGGGVSGLNGSGLILNSVISGNECDGDGGGMYFTNCVWQMSDCEISDNVSYNSGGGVYCEYSNIVSTGCIIKGNGTTGAGGGVRSLISDFIMSHCEFIGNTTADRGGAVYCYMGNTIVRNCVMSGGLAVSGGAMYCNRSNPLIANSTISDNWAENGNGIACDSSSQSYPSAVEISNSILWDGQEEIWNNDESVVSISYSDVFGGWAGEGNIDEDPQFIQAGYWDDNGTVDDESDDFWVEGDYHLAEGSVCIDAGDPDFVMEEQVDIDGDARVIGERIDIGADETVPSGGGEIEVEVKLSPNVLNVKSNGKYVVVQMLWSEAISFGLDDVSGAYLEGAVEAVEVLLGEEDYIVVMKFDRGQVGDYLIEHDIVGEVELSVRLELLDGTVFEGENVITVINKGGNSKY